ncbi:hypothetical protein [uncultured Pseudodesulfovibrio sp.]|uniref:hypothetical protein n=1 Tax=uncultured Pseudodesulfovibrio sp. TaxID=2035858 RepID=UPI0029C98407|nr:hypothetical protein [uncultured Pseudodesulfovibrio sp.]
MKRIICLSKDILRDSFTASVEMFKVMIPVIIIVKLLQEFGLISYLAWPLKPLMGLVGLPAEMGLVWATAIVNNIYAGLIVFASIAGDFPLTQAQATILACLMLVAHGLPLENSIARKAGARFMFQSFSRLAGAFTLGWLLNIIYSTTNTLQAPAMILFKIDPQAANKPLTTWALDQAMNLLSIFVIILALIIMMRILQAIRVIDLMNAVLRPILKLIGIGPKASAITVIGLTMGLSYGGGLIINESKSGNVSKEDIFYSLTLMGLCHSLIEDTLLLALIGGHFSGIFWGRLIFAVAALAVVVQVVRRLPDSFKNKYLWVAKQPAQ